MPKFMCMAAYTTDTGLSQEFAPGVEGNTVFSSEENAKEAAALFMYDYPYAGLGESLTIKWWGLGGEFKGIHGECCFTIFQLPEQCSYKR